METKITKVNFFPPGSDKETYELRETTSDGEVLEEIQVTKSGSVILKLVGKTSGFEKYLETFYVPFRVHYYEEKEEEEDGE